MKAAALFDGDKTLVTVNTARLINPDPRLRLLSLRRGYPMETWT